jgi:hypothetical protein
VPCPGIAEAPPAQVAIILVSAIILRMHAFSDYCALRH